jgi:hypothetical protein
MRGWVDINGRHHYVTFTNITGNRPAFRRFCGDCGKLRKCYVWTGEVRCLDCSKQANVVTLIDEGFSAITREKRGPGRRWRGTLARSRCVLSTVVRGRGHSTLP